MENDTFDVENDIFDVENDIFDVENDIYLVSKCWYERISFLPNVFKCI